MSGGVIIAGGRSRRFGDADKAVAELAGTPMIRRVAGRLTPTVDQLVVNCREDQLDAIQDAMAGYEHPVTYAEDERPDLGPMAGIRTGLDAVAAEYAFVVACDMPFVEPALAEYLFERAEGHDAAVPRLDDEWFQTTQAVYRADAMASSCQRALERGDRKIIEPLFELDYVVLDEPEFESVAHQRTFENINTREEFDAANKRIGGER
jgi:molybdopterin-guanine dinucleotide biosynthesis protein A